MRAHAEPTIPARSRAFGEHKAELKGRLPGGPYEFSPDLEFDVLKPVAGDPPAVRRFKLAVRRDARYGSARPAFLRVFGFSQNLRSIYDGGRQLLDGGAT